MAYSTGTATGVNDLMVKIRDFCEANGWTRDSDGTESTGRRWHAHRGSVYVNFRSHASEIPNANISRASGSAIYSIAMNVGTGYSGASAWYNQAGVPQGTSSKYQTAGMELLTGAITSYHFFAHNSGDSIMLVVEYTSGFYQFLCFGSLTKYGTYTGGEYFIGSRPGMENNAFSAYIPRVGFVDSASSSNDSPPSFINCTVDGEAGWKWARAASGLNRPTSGIRHVTCNYKSFYTTLGIQPNTLNNLSVLMPVIPRVFRDTSNVEASSYTSPLGEIAKVYYCRISAFTPGQQITFGSTNYRVFPFFRKNNDVSDPTTAGTPSSSYFGFAVEE